MKAVVVGGSGFLGGAVVAELQARGDEVVVFDAQQPVGPWAVDAEVVVGSVLDRDALEPVCKGADEVYHLAGELGTSELEDAVADAVQVNVLGSVNVFEAAVRGGVPTVFFPAKPNVWRNVYSITKDCAAQFAALYAERFEVAVPSLCWFNAYGPRQHLAPVRKLVPFFTAQALRGRPLEVFGDGEQTVDLVHSRDLAALTVAFTRQRRDDAVLDCGRGIPVTVNEVAEAVNAVTGNRAGVRHVPMRLGETPGTTLVADPAPLLERLGGFAFRDWEQSLAETVAWYAALPAAELDAGLAAHGAG